MSRKSDKVDLDALTERLDKLLAEAPPQDLLIMGFGLVAGWNGYTPITGLMNMGGNAVSTWQDLVDKASKGDVIAGGMAGMPLGLAGGAIGMMYAAFAGPINAMTGEREVVVEPDKVKIMRDAIAAKTALACIGAIEAYAITRPGTVAGIGEIVRGIGDIIPG